MSHAAVLQTQSPASRAGASALITALAAWLGLVAWLGAAGVFVAPDGAPPLQLLAVVLGPVLACLIAYRVSPAVRALALKADLKLITATHAWRFGGFTFLALYAYGVLPAYFAWPAGLGDMAIAATAPWMLAGLARGPEFGASRRFVIWNLLGILDLLVAVTAGAAVPFLFPNAASATSMDAMARLPLVLIPGFFVPGFLILHLTALARARAAGPRKEDGTMHSW